MSVSVVFMCVWVDSILTVELVFYFSFGSFLPAFSKIFARNSLHISESFSAETEDK